MGENTSVTTVKDEVSGVFSRLCTTACSDDKALKLARDNLRRLSLRIRDGESDYDAVLQCVLEKFYDDKTKDEWFVKYKLLEVFPIFARTADLKLVTAAGKALLHDNWMVRQSAVEALAFLMSSQDQPHIPSRPGSKTNSRPASPGIRRPGGLTAKPRPKQGVVVGEVGAVVKGRRRAASPTSEQDPTNMLDKFDDFPVLAHADEKLLDPHVLDEDQVLLHAPKGSSEQESAVEALFRCAKEALRHGEVQIRKCALQAMSKSLPVGHFEGLEAGRTALADESWECREAALHLLREIAITGDQESIEVVLDALEDPRWEVREAAVKALETMVIVGDDSVTERLVSKEQHSKAWGARTGRKAWELRETACKALGRVAEAGSEGAMATLSKALGDESGAVQRAAARALGEVAEREAPEDMVWTYNNATALPAKPSTWLHTKWSSLRQQHVPASVKAAADTQTKHSPRESVQLLCRTPRGGALPHLLTTPRNEHLYEGEAVAQALEVREERRRALERGEELEEVALRLAGAMEAGDTDAVRRLQARLAALQAGEGGEVPEELEDVVEGEGEQERDWG